MSDHHAYCNGDAITVGDLVWHRSEASWEGVVTELLPAGRVRIQWETDAPHDAVQEPRFGLYRDY
jgi:hypothetical protein